ncbi:MAG: hypothetical protein KDC92_11185 [Bacteroidetes bacterium]|nr:hypothetical protein [Bacteroidota bacterium]
MKTRIILSAIVLVALQACSPTRFLKGTNMYLVGHSPVEYMPDPANMNPMSMPLDPMSYSDQVASLLAKGLISEGLSTSYVESPESIKNDPKQFIINMPMIMIREQATPQQGEPEPPQEIKIDHAAPQGVELKEPGGPVVSNTLSNMAVELRTTVSAFNKGGQSIDYQIKIEDQVTVGELEKANEEAGKTIDYQLYAINKVLKKVPQSATAIVIKHVKENK